VGGILEDGQPEKRRIIMSKLSAMFKIKPRLDGLNVEPGIDASMEISHEPYPIDVIGESKHRQELDDICGRPERKVSVERPARLIPAEENPHCAGDRHPVRVEIDGKTVGYLDPGPALDYFERFGRITLKCMANIRGGGWVRDRKYRGNYGVRLTYDRK
jgi:hypothetical protein